MTPALATKPSRPVAPSAGREFSARALRSLRNAVDETRGEGLTPEEVAELDMIAFAYLIDQDRRAERAIMSRELRRVASFARATREPALIASLGSSDAPVQPWEGVIGAEGRLTGDGRLIEFGALEFAKFPMPLRWAPVDLGGHDGAVLVGLIHGVRREKNGLIRAQGVLDLGSDVGREATRLIRGHFLSGVSFDLDSTVQAATEAGGPGIVFSGGRVRAATLVAIPAFDEARIELTDDRDPAATTAPTVAPEIHAADCGCGELSAAGVATSPTAHHLLTYRPRH